MPGGGLMQLVAYGALDIYLTAGPQLSKVVYLQPTKLSHEITKNRLICNKDKLLCPIEYTIININDKYQHCIICNNNFCNDSIIEWLKINNSCPMCRNEWKESIIYVNKEDIGFNEN